MVGVCRPDPQTSARTGGRRSRGRDALASSTKQRRGRAVQWISRDKGAIARASASYSSSSSSSSSSLSVSDRDLILTRASDSEPLPWNAFVRPESPLQADNAAGAAGGWIGEDAQPMSYWPKHRMKSLLTAVAWREPEKLQQQPNLEAKVSYLVNSNGTWAGQEDNLFLPQGAQNQDSRRATELINTKFSDEETAQIAAAAAGNHKAIVRIAQAAAAAAVAEDGAEGRGGGETETRVKGDATVAEDTLLEALASIAALCGEARVVRIMIDPLELHDSFSGLAWLGKLLRVVIDHVDRLGSSSSSSSSSPEEKEAEAAAVVSGRFHAQLMLLCASLLSSALEVTQMGPPRLVAVSQIRLS